MLDEGYAAVTSRRIAQEAGVTPPLVHYYFPTLDDLFIAVFRRRGDEQLERQARLLAGDHPLHAVWDFNGEPASAAFMAEFMALANHRKSIGAEIATYVERFREGQIAALAGAVDEGRLDVGDTSVPALVMLLTNAARSVVTERSIGLTMGHDETIALVERLIDQAEPTPTRARGRTTKAPATRAAKASSAKASSAKASAKASARSTKRRAARR